MKWLIIPIALALVAFIGFTQTEYIRCSGKFVRPGARDSEVLKLCGSPVARETSESERIPLGGPRVIYEGQFVERDVPEESSQIVRLSESWIYKMGDRKFRLTFTGEGRKDTFGEERPTLHLKKIEKLKRGG